MAWISVHESVDGPKLRQLYKEIGCPKAEALGMLVFLWMWGLNNAEKDGKILCADREDIARHLYGVCAGSNVDMLKVVDAMFNTGWLEELHDDDRAEQIIELHDWDMWQKEWYKALDRRDADKMRKRESRKQTGTSDTKSAAGISQQKSTESPEDIPAENQTSIPGMSDDPEKLPEKPTEEPPEEKAEKPTKVVYPLGFEAFWSVYPRKVGKGEAYKKYKARTNDGYSDEELISAAKEYAACCRKSRTENQYIKHAKTFLSDSCPFLDYLPKKAAPIQADNSNPFAEYGEV